jgi:glycosyltransferase involved in cell wall biosynthesis
MNPDKPSIKVLHILVCLDSGGVETLLLDFFKRLPDHVHFDFLVMHPGIRDNIVEEKGSRVFVMPFEVIKKPWQLGKFTAKLIDEHHYDVVHCHRLIFNGNILRHAKRAGVSVRIAHCHATFFQETSRLKRFLYTPWHYTINRIMLVRYATDILACSREAGRFLMGWLWKRLAKCRPFYNGIPLDEFVQKMEMTTRRELCEQYGIPHESVVVGHLGRMVPVKNQQLLIEAFAILARKNPKVVLFIGGEGELRPQLERQCRELGISDRVFMPGFCSDSPGLFGNLFDVFCFPSIAEGFGIVLIEAVAAGLHGICSDSIPKDVIEQFPDRITPIPLNAHPQVWADAIEKVLVSKIPRENGIALIKNASMTTESQLNVLLAIYANVY